jgi:lipopolysaccharide/colanic/teichoic acid biosynthesis glycosyltransferase
MYTIVFKRLFDFGVALIILVFLSPIVISVILLLAFYNNGKVFFLQKRPGRNDKQFVLIKFKTMRDLYDRNGVLLPDKDRVTSIGKFVRKMSIDELPQLVNVLIGDMSLVGPRPLLIQYLPFYSEVQRRRHEVKPGITGWAQVNGRNAISWQRKFELDVYYVDHISFVLDLKILLHTFVRVLKGAEVNASASTTMMPFNGKN